MGVCLCSSLQASLSRMLALDSPRPSRRCHHHPPLTNYSMATTSKTSIMFPASDQRICCRLDFQGLTTFISLATSFSELLRTITEADPIPGLPLPHVHGPDVPRTPSVRSRCTRARRLQGAFPGPRPVAGLATDTAMLGPWCLGEMTPELRAGGFAYTVA